MKSFNGATQLRKLLHEPGLIVLPGAHDCLMAKLVEATGFPVPLLEMERFPSLGWVVPILGLSISAKWLIAPGKFVEACPCRLSSISGPATATL